MPQPISALELTPMDTIREVSPKAIDFYVDELSGIYLPEDYMRENIGIEGWKKADRLKGKFGRYALKYENENEQKKQPINDILLIGTTIELTDGYGMELVGLRHITFHEKLWHIIGEWELATQPISIEPADYGSTSIKLGLRKRAKSISIGGKSFDFGRADTEGRQRTCDLFTELLGGSISVVNSDPEPNEYDKIIDIQH